MSPLSTSFCPIKEGAIENKQLYCTTEQNRLANSSGSTRMRKTVLDTSGSDTDDALQTIQNLVQDDCDIYTDVSDS